MTERFSLRRTLHATVAVALFSATSTSIAAEGVDALARSDIGASYSEIYQIVNDMLGAVATAESALDDVKTMTVQDGNARVSEYFKQMKDKVNGMLERLGPNSVLMDNQEGAKANVIVIKRWLERQPADFPNRDKQIVRLEQTLTDYDSLADQIVEGRLEAQQQLAELSRARFYADVDQMVKDIVESVETTKRVVVSLQSLSGRHAQGCGAGTSPAAGDDSGLNERAPQILRGMHFPTGHSTIRTGGRETEMRLRSIAAGIAILAMPLVGFAQADEGEPDIAKLFEDVRSVAGDLEANIAGLEEALSASIDSQEQGAEVLDQMQASAEAVFAKLAEDSEIWTALVKAMELWDDRQKEMLEKSETNPAFKQISDEWGFKVEQANELRKQILTQRAESMALLDQIGADREVVLAYYELGQADRALEAMKKVSGELGRMNDSMRAIVEQTKEIAGPAVPQQ